MSNIPTPSIPSIPNPNSGTESAVKEVVMYWVPCATQVPSVAMTSIVADEPDVEAAVTLTVTVVLPEVLVTETGLVEVTAADHPGVVGVRIAVVSATELGFGRDVQVSV